MVEHIHIEEGLIPLLLQVSGFIHCVFSNFSVVPGVIQIGFHPEHEHICVKLLVDDLWGEGRLVEL